MKDRNDTAHCNGQIVLTSQDALDRKIEQVLRAVRQIEARSACVIEECYRAFLLDSYDPDVREYLDVKDQIREVLVHGNYLSQKDMEMCLGFDLEQLADHPEIEGIRELHQALVAEYGQE